VPPTGAGTGAPGGTGLTDPICTAMMTVEVELHTFSDDHRERMSVERTPLPPPGPVTSSDGTQGVLGQRGAFTDVRPMGTAPSTLCA